MPFDGFVLKSVVHELNKVLTGSRVEKIYQPEKDEIILITRNTSSSHKLLLSANATCSRIHITKTTKDNPLTPPPFCMVLRKHLQGAKILNITFLNYERIAEINFESYNELGDTCVKKLIIEIMGKHSNIILVNDSKIIIDALKHIDQDISSVREVMPARPYTPPPIQLKLTIDELKPENFFDNLTTEKNIAIEKYILNSIKGSSPYLCKLICHISGIDPSCNLNNISWEQKQNIIKTLYKLSDISRNNKFEPILIFKDKVKREFRDFYCINFFTETFYEKFDSINALIDYYFSLKDKNERINQKKNAIKKIIYQNIQRLEKKLFIHNETLRETSDFQKLKLYGELILAYIYSIPKDSNLAHVLNYYSDKEEYIDIPLDPNLSLQENANIYYKKYNKAKISRDYANHQIMDIKQELNYLESVNSFINNCESNEDLEAIKEELTTLGYLSESKKISSRRRNIPSKPHHFTSSDGLDIFIGKNNIQNDELTFKIASSNDIWMHTKNIPGSHTIIFSNNKNIPDSTINEAAILCAYYSKARNSSKVPVDYTTVKNVKKIKGAKPGMVIYKHYKTIFATPDEEKVKQLHRTDA